MSATLGFMQDVWIYCPKFSQFYTLSTNLSTTAHKSSFHSLASSASSTLDRHRGCFVRSPRRNFRSLRLPWQVNVKIYAAITRKYRVIWQWILFFLGQQQPERSHQFLLIQLSPKKFISFLLSHFTPTAAWMRISLRTLCNSSLFKYTMLKIIIIHKELSKTKKSFLAISILDYHDDIQGMQRRVHVFPVLRCLEVS